MTCVLKLDSLSAIKNLLEKLVDEDVLDYSDLIEVGPIWQIFDSR